MRYRFLFTLSAISLAVPPGAGTAMARTRYKASSQDRPATPARAAEPAKPAETPKPAEPEAETKPLTDKDPTIMDAAKTPLTDLNLGRDNEIPPILKAAIADPYTLKGLDKCGRLTAAVTELDEALGPDIDLPKNERARLSEGRIARWAIASFIPFRGLIREVTGANRQDELVGDAIQAGQTRRGFLKGVGLARKCKYPARPATPEMIRAALVGPPPHTQAPDGTGKSEKGKNGKDRTAKDDSARKPAKADPKDAKASDGTAKSDKGKRSSRKVKYTSQPVVQPLP